MIRKLKISSIREIKKYLSINYDEIKHRMIIIEEAHLLSVEAQNALLKSLEEPPEGVIFVLISDKPEMLLTTIKSRCWELTFSPLTDENIENILTNNFMIDGTTAKSVIPFSDGSIHRVFILLNFGFENLIDATINILRYSMGKRYNTAIKIFHSAIEENPKILLPIIIQLMIIWFTDVQKQKFGFSNIQFQKSLNTINKFIEKFNSAELDKIIFQLTDLNKNIDFSINLNLLILNIIFNLSAIVKR